MFPNSSQPLYLQLRMSTGLCIFTCLCMLTGLYTCMFTCPASRLLMSFSMFNNATSLLNTSQPLYLQVYLVTGICMFTDLFSCMFRGQASRLRQQVAQHQPAFICTSISGHMFLYVHGSQYMYVHRSCQSVATFILHVHQRHQVTQHQPAQGRPHGCQRDPLPQHVLGHCRPQLYLCTAVSR